MRGPNVNGFASQWNIGLNLHLHLQPLDAVSIRLSHEPFQSEHKVRQINHLNTEYDQNSLKMSNWEENMLELINRNPFN